MFTESEIPDRSNGPLLSPIAPLFEEGQWPKRTFSAGRSGSRTSWSPWTPPCSICARRRSVTFFYPQLESRGHDKKVLVPFDGQCQIRSGDRQSNATLDPLSKKPRCISCLRAIRPVILFLWQLPF